MIKRIEEKLGRRSSISGENNRPNFKGLTPQISPFRTKIEAEEMRNFFEDLDKDVEWFDEFEKFIKTLEKGKI